MLGKSTNDIHHHKANRQSVGTSVGAGATATLDTSTAGSLPLDSTLNLMYNTNVGVLVIINNATNISVVLSNNSPVAVVINGTSNQAIALDLRNSNAMPVSVANATISGLMGSPQAAIQSAVNIAATIPSVGPALSGSVMSNSVVNMNNLVNAASLGLGNLLASGSSTAGNMLNNFGGLIQNCIKMKMQMMNAGLSLGTNALGLLTGNSILTIHFSVFTLNYIK